MWPRRSHILAPLTALTGKKFKWDPEHEKSFQQMKALIAKETLLVYPDHNIPFDIESDASDYQLGAVIKQHGKPVAYYTQKLNSAQQNYSTIEKELLSIVETLKEFRTVLLGAEIRIHTDHKNLTHDLSAFTTQRVTRWRILLDEFGASFHYKTGETNFIADALSRVPTTRTERMGKHHSFDPFTVSQPPDFGLDTTVADDYLCSTLDDPELLELFMFLPDSELFPLPDAPSAPLPFPHNDSANIHSYNIPFGMPLAGMNPL